MIKHIVSWKIKTEIEDKTKAAKLLKTSLENLNGKIPGMIHLEVGIDFSKSDTSADIVLYSEFESKEALAGYAVHPLHVEAAAIVREHTFNRTLTDYEI